MPSVISFINQKGGVGKSTSSFTLAYRLNQSGKNVLLIDLDPQASLTILTGIHDPNSLQYSISDMLLDTLQDKTEFSNNFVRQLGQNLDLVPSNIQLSGIETMLVNAMSRENVLRTSISQIKDLYDYVIIDCMPSLSSVQWTGIEGLSEIFSNDQDSSNIVSTLVFALFLALILLLAACLGIVNAFSSNLQQRKQQIGLLRAVGATKQQIRQIFGREAMLISVFVIPIALTFSWHAPCCWCNWARNPKIL